MFEKNEKKSLNKEIESLSKEIEAVKKNQIISYLWRQNSASDSRFLI